VFAAKPNHDSAQQLPGDEAIRRSHGLGVLTLRESRQSWQSTPYTTALLGDNEGCGKIKLDLA
jgi:hypothetical protein